MKLVELRSFYHQKIIEKLIRINRAKSDGGYPNNADGNSSISVKIAWRILDQLSSNPLINSLSGQTAGKIFEQLTMDYLKSSFEKLSSVRPGPWQYYIEKEISHFEQYSDLAAIEKALKEHKELGSTFGRDYIIKPDIIIARESLADDKINEQYFLIGKNDKIASYTPLRCANNRPPHLLLHASISCKWTLRSDRAQNVKTEALNLIRNRKGHLPHIVAVTAEPTCTRIASLTLGTGDIDCVYHFALYELINAINDLRDESQLDLLAMLIEGKRLRDISDLPLDLAI